MIERIFICFNRIAGIHFDLMHLIFFFVIKNLQQRIKKRRSEKKSAAPIEPACKSYISKLNDKNQIVMFAASCRSQFSKLTIQSIFLYISAKQTTIDKATPDYTAQADMWDGEGEREVKSDSQK